MIGPEIAAALAPFAKWGALVAGALLLVWLLRFWIRQGAKADEELETIKDIEEERSDARNDLRATRRRMRSVWRRMRDRQGR
jgi:type VI protein secretion system component VasK